MLNTEITENPELLKTELNLEPIRVDGLFLLKTNKNIIHLEFQTVHQSKIEQVYLCQTHQYSFQQHLLNLFRHSENFS